MEKKRKMSRDKLQGFVELSPQQLADLYKPKAYESISYTVNVNKSPKVVVDSLMTMLYQELLDCIDEMVETSDLAEAKQVIARVK